MTALRDCELFRITPDVFSEVTQRYPRRMVNVYQSITERLYKNVAARPPVTHASIVAILTASESVRIGAFTRDLLRLILEYDTVECLDSRSVDRALG